MVEIKEEVFIASIVGLTLQNYRHGKQVFLNGIEEVVNAMDYKKISIEKAAEISTLPKMLIYKR